MRIRLSVLEKEGDIINENLQENSQQQRLEALPERVIIRLQAMWKSRQQRKHYLQAIKKYRYRKSIVNEIVGTERIYVSDLRFLSQIQKDLKIRSTMQDKILESKDIKALFQNIEAIYGLAEQLLEALEKAFKGFNCSTMIGDVMYTHANFFKLYFEYVNNYTLAEKLYSKLKKENTKFKEYISYVERKTLQGHSMESFLIKPVQRVPRYVLLLKDLKKSTPDTHRDYKNIETALQAFEKVNEDNNKNMDRTIINSKLFDLQRQFGNEKLKIVDAKREFKSEESLSIFTQHDIKPVIVYFMNNLILITERETIYSKLSKQEKIHYKLITHIDLDEYSQVKDMEDNDHLQNFFNLLGKNETITFVCENQEIKQKRLLTIQDILEDLKKKSMNKKEAFQTLNVKSDKPFVTKYPIQVEVLGTQELVDNNDKKYTRYIVQVDIANITQRIYLRWNEFKQLQKLAQEQLPNLKLPYFKDDKNWYNKLDPKVIEGRKIQILNFLQILLTSEEMEKKGQQILQFLELPQNFLTLPDLLSQQSLEQTESLSNAALIRNKRGSFISSRTSSMTSNNVLDLSVLDSRLKLRSSGLSNGFHSPRLPIKPVQAQDILNQVSQKLYSAQKPEESSLGNSRQTVMSEKTSQLRSNSIQNQRKISASKLVRTSQPTVNSTKSSMIGTRISDLVIPEVKIKVNIYTYPKTTELEINITQSTRASDALEQIAFEVSLQETFDFRLYIQEKIGLRPIEDDELMWTLLVEKNTASQSTSQKLTSFLKKMTQYIYSYNQKQVFLKKHLYLPKENEKELLEDPKRTELIAQQIVQDVSLGNLRLSVKEYTMFAALKLYFEGYRLLDTKNIPLKLIEECLPPTVYKLIQKDIWSTFLPDMLQNFDDQIKEIQMSNVTELNLAPSPPSRFKTEPAFEDDDKNDSQHSRQLTHSDVAIEVPDTIKIAELVLIDLIESTQFYGLKPFMVTLEKETRNYLQKICHEQFKNYLKTQPKSAQNQQNPQFTENNILFCVGFEVLSIFNNFSEIRPLVKLPYREIQSVKDHTQSLVITMNPITQDNFLRKTVTLRFNTGQSFVIQALIQEYIQIKEVLEQDERIII